MLPRTQTMNQTMNSAHYIADRIRSVRHPRTPKNAGWSNTVDMDLLRSSHDVAAAQSRQIHVL